MKVYRVRRFGELHYFPAIECEEGYEHLLYGGVTPLEKVGEAYCIGELDGITKEDWDYHFEGEDWELFLEKRRARAFPEKEWWER